MVKITLFNSLLILFLVIFPTLNAQSSLVGKMLPTVSLSGDFGGTMEYTEWNTDSLRGKVHLILYVDPDYKDLNQDMQIALEAEPFDNKYYQPVAIVNMAATWAPNGIIELKIKSNQKKNPKVVYIRDRESVLVKQMGLADDAYVTLLTDANGKVVFHENGLLTSEKISEMIDLTYREMSKIAPKGAIKKRKNNTYSGQLVHHPIPTKPIYLKENLYKKLKSKLPPPPLAESREQKQDEAALFSYQKKRSKQQCALAKAEIFVSLKSFFREPKKILTLRELKVLTQLFDQVRNDGDFFIQKIKASIPRLRPFAYVDGLIPCIAKEVTNAYPSGHATLAKLYSLILSDLFPERRSAFIARGEQIGLHRVLSGMHHPSDISSGQHLGADLYKALLKSKEFNSDLARYKKQLE